MVHLNLFLGVICDANPYFLIIVTILLAGFPLFPVPFPYFYSAEPIEAWIGDEESEKPLEGVVIVAAWTLEWNSIAGHMPAGQLKVMETVTDKNGRFYFPAWGLKLAMNGHLDHETPELTIFKSGYSYKTVSNDLFQKQSGMTRRSDWDSKNIPLSKFKDSLEEYAKSLTSLSSMLGYNFRTQKNECQWKKIPHMVVALHKQKSIFDKKIYIKSLLQNS